MYWEPAWFLGSSYGNQLQPVPMNGKEVMKTGSKIKYSSALQRAFPSAAVRFGTCGHQDSGSMVTL